MSKIKVMKEVLANKIAAGEVIERPLSVVKEVVENSLDAKASKIKIELEDSGIKKMIVTDNGLGMNDNDLPLAIKRHATSKLYDDKDLFKISTLGFRGEALPSIYAVSKVEISSSTDGVGGLKLTKIDDENYDLNPVAMNKGTIISIENLFYNTPVRYKHLSNPFYELSIIVNYINKLALIHANVSFELINNGNGLVKTSGGGDPRTILAKQYSPSIAKKMLHFSAKNEHFEVELYSSHPHDTRSRKSHITIGLNERLIRNYDIENKIINSYGTFLHTGQYPIAFINIKVNYSLIDVNVHPTKQQVKISLIDNLLDLIEENVKRELGELEYMANPSDIEVKQFTERVSDSDKYEVNRQLDELFSDVKRVNARESVNILESKDDGKSVVIEQVLPNKVQQNDDEGNIGENDKLTEELRANSLDVFDDQIFNINKTNVSHNEDLFSLDSDEKKISEVQRIPLFSFIGTLHNTYILCENGEGLYLIDQHAAQERINYELIMDSFKNRQFQFQQVMYPIIITLNEIESKQLEERISETEKFGFKLESFGINSFKVTELDSWISNRPNATEDITEMVNSIIDKKHKSFDEYYEEVAIMMACKKSIKAHQRVNKTESEYLLAELNKCRQPYTCPHGRPVIVKITTKEIEKMFKRVF